MVLLNLPPEAFHKLGTEIVTRDPAAANLELRDYVAFFGTSPTIVSELWNLIDNKVKSAKPMHILWACMFMKLYIPEDALCILLGTSKNTMRKWMWYFIEEISLLSVKIVSLCDRAKSAPSTA